MAIKGAPGEHLATARELLASLGPNAGGTGDAQVRATTAVAHAVLALAEQVGMLRGSLEGPPGHHIESPS